MEDIAAVVRYTIKDSVFTTLFRQLIYALELYRALHPEDKTVTLAECQIVTIERIISRGIYNDFGMLVRDKLIFLVEAQSVFSPNMPYRMLGYLAVTYKNYISAHDGMNVFSSKAVVLPRPELYVLYTGKEERVPETLRLSDLYEGAGDVEVVVHVLRGDNCKGILAEYTRFCEIVDKTRIERGRGQAALERILNRCMAEGVLTEFLERHREEVISVWAQLYDQEEVTRMTLREAQLESEQRGRRQGREEGRKEGREQGREEGRERGICFLTVAMQKLGHSRDDTIRMVGEQYGLTEEEAVEKVTLYWKP